jgi:hypothetical protein
MAKYDPLRRYLARQKTVRVALSFREIERLIGAFLPKAALTASWWSTPEPSAAQAKAWPAAGYRARLDAGELVVFERVTNLAPPRVWPAAPPQPHP